ncbi:MAG: hypothetical protein IK123_12360, partial [Lachnospiraceae bacterium]|nr:hypothetical protein [Lachnospiraceae bacterium]
MADIQKDINLEELEELAAQSETQIANKTTLVCYTVITSILSAAYVLEVFKGARTVGYIAVTLLLALVPVAIAWVFYKQDVDTPAIIHVASIGYGALYTFLIFTAQNDLVFTYAIP